MQIQGAHGVDLTVRGQAPSSPALVAELMALVRAYNATAYVLAPPRGSQTPTCMGSIDLLYDFRMKVPQTQDPGPGRHAQVEALSNDPAYPVETDCPFNDERGVLTPC